MTAPAKLLLLRRRMWLDWARTRPAAVAVVIAAVALISAAPAAASERHPTLPELEGQVICPTCHESLDQSTGHLADRERALIRHWIAAGQTASQIKQKLVDQFGPQILAAPPRHGFNLLAWWLPIVGVLVGA